MMRFLACFLVAASVIYVTAAAPASASVLAYYPLGESGSVGASNAPIDVVGGHNFQNAINSATVVPPGAGGAPGSTEALSFNGSDGYYFTDGDFIPADNFRVELWANPVAQPLGSLFSLGASDGAITIGITNNGGEYDWFAGASNVNWIGAVAGAGQTATLNAWTDLAVEQVNGVMTFYINGVAQGALAYSNPGANGGATMHLGVIPGGTNYFTGGLDELTISAVPEPSGALLLLVGIGVCALGRAASRRIHK